MQSNFSKTVAFGLCRGVAVKRLSCLLSRLRRLLSAFKLLKNRQASHANDAAKAFWRLIPKVSLQCKATNVDFQLCRCRKDGHKVRRKVESSNSDEKSCGLELKGGRIFWAEQKREEMDYPSCRWGGKSSSGFESRLASTGLPKQLCPASTSSIEIPQTPPPPPKKVEIDQMNNMNILVHHCAILSFVILNFIQMPFRVLKLSMDVTQHRALKVVTSRSMRLHKSLIFDRFLESWV